MIFYFIIFLISKVFPYCKEGMNFCSKCDLQKKLCVKCVKSVFSPDKYGGCENSRKCIIGNNYCLECSEDGKLCKVCEIGYFPDENGGCSYSNNCDVSYKGECLKCKDNYILVGKNNDNINLNKKLRLCKSLSSEQFLHCKDIYIDLGICNNCEDGYYLSYSDLKCTKIKNCAYSYFGECNKCDYGYYYDKNQKKCLIQEDLFINCKISYDGKICNECDDDTYLNKGEKCFFSNYCLEGEKYHCNKCIDGYYLTVINGICTTEENCFDGRKDIGVCTKCKEFYCLDFKDGKCKYNLEDNDYKFCKLADENGCIECIEKAFLSNNKRCSETPNCDIVTLGNCTKCIEDYYLGLDNKCTNVEYCIYSDNNYNCIECKENYFLNKIDNKCKIGEGRFENCKYGNDDNCERCKDDFYLNKTDNLCYSHKINKNFNKCEITEREQCIQCKEDYYLAIKDNKCSKVEHCLEIENENKCLYCEDNYCADGKTGKCEFNFVILKEDKKFYYRCNRTNEDSTGCEICLEGYDLRNGICVDEKHCVDKNIDEGCKKCEKKDGENYSQCLNDLFGCIETMFYDNCLECNSINEIGRCTKCIEGYRFNKYNFCEIIEKLE